MYQFHTNMCTCINSEVDKYDISLQIINCPGQYEGMHYNREWKITELNIQSQDIRKGNLQTADILYWKVRTLSACGKLHKRGA